MTFYLDENLSPRFAKLLQVFDEVNEYVLIKAEFGSGAKDPDWMKALSEKKERVGVVSLEKNLLRDPSCRQSYDNGQVCIVYLRRNWADFALETQMWKLLRVWPKIRSTIGASQSQATFTVSIKSTHIGRR